MTATLQAIVVGVDATVPSERALQRALLEAHRSSAELRVVHAWTTPVWTGGLPGFDYSDLASPTDSEKFAQELVEELVAKVLSPAPHTPPARVRTEVRHGDPGHVLVRASQDASLVVVGGRGHGYVTSALLGSVTDYVVHHSHCPTMVVPETGPPAGLFRQIIVGVDGSPSSRAALRWGVEEARRHDCPVIALHAWLITTLPGRTPGEDRHGPAPFETEARQWLEREVAEVTPDADVGIALTHGGTTWALLEMAGPDDLLVLGSRGRGGFASLVLGSTATQCSRHARGVVVVVRAGPASPS